MSRLAAFVIAVFVCTPASAQTSRQFVDGREETLAWDQMVGQMVTVDGMAWGAFEKGLGPRLVLPVGAIYVRDVDLLKHDLNGRLLRVSGVLRKGRMDAAPPGAQGFAAPIDYFYIETLSAERVEKVERDQLLSSTHEWLHIGMDEAAAVALLVRYGGQKTALQVMAEPPGQARHTYNLVAGEAITLVAAAGRVISIDRVVFGNSGRRDNEFYRLRAYPMPKVRQQIGRGKSGQ